MNNIDDSFVRRLRELNEKSTPTDLSTDEYRVEHCEMSDLSDRDRMLIEELRKSHEASRCKSTNNDDGDTFKSVRLRILK